MKHEKLEGTWDNVVLRSLAEGNPSRAAKIDHLLFQITTAGAELDAMVDEQEALLGKTNVIVATAITAEMDKPKMIGFDKLDEATTSPVRSTPFVGPLPAAPSLLKNAPAGQPDKAKPEEVVQHADGRGIDAKAALALLAGQTVAPPMPIAPVVEPEVQGPPAPTKPAVEKPTIPLATSEILPPQSKPAEQPAPKAKAPEPKPARNAPPIIEADRGPLKSPQAKTVEPKPAPVKKAIADKTFHKRTSAPTFTESLQNGIRVVRTNLAIVMGFTVFINVLVLAIPIYLFQISDRVLTSRSLDTLIMLTAVIVGAVIMQVVLDAIRRFILMRTAVEVAVQLGSPILSAAARASLHGNGRDYQVLGDLQQVRAFITSGTLLAFFDAPMAPLFVLAVFLIHPELGYIVVGSALCLLVVALINQRLTAKPFAEANGYLSRATLHLDSMSRNSQIINALAMIPEAVRIWGRDTAASLTAHVDAQDRNIIMASISKCIRLLTQVCMLGWGATLAIEGHITGGMVIAGSIVASRALSPIEGAIEGWNGFTQFRTSFARIRGLLQSSPFNFERLILPNPKGRVDVERLLFVPPPNKKVLLNGISFSLLPGESLAVIGNSGAGKTTLGKMLVGSILPTSGSVRLDMMDLRNWDQRQFGESIGYLPQDVQLFPGTIKANIARMREDVTDQSIFDAAVLADVHELIASFPQGYETFVAADGAPLSGGQKQRIALARAFFGSPKMVVLDEPNSNLDAPGEAALAKALMHAKKENITVITITQRPALLNVVDKILVLNNGSVSLFGSRTEVMTALARNKTTSGDVGLAAPASAPIATGA
ncbi:MAG: type I secretion system permease/ATPase [Candidatus Devosia phytovorans]|uniref:Type I secretion system permease/ATPase n=1 Tax=Candidatus Devosia phytovorans TaxID=3121372 RepID=A0AAJ5VSK7_9HYPH|nr:type I secretion system permease/ATPase [Devosia sp.]WEK02897.1 MAG: type I secretion system permease/ATPase [Devosia sp.]